MALSLSRAAKLATVLLAGTMAWTSAEACTGITFTAKDGSVVRGRTMEFNYDMKSNVIVSPRGFERTGTTPDGTPGLTWKAKYASVGTNALDIPVMIDGLNEKGLSAGIFYFAESAKYQDYTAEDAGKTLGIWELASYILDNFATTEEVKDALPNVLVAASKLQPYNVVLPGHLVVTDVSGKTIVIEYSQGGLHIFDNEVGVITNNPTFDWHMQNLQNYVNLNLDNAPSQKVGQATIQGFGQGTGLLGMPGDFTAPSRFVRATIFSNGVPQPENAEDATFETFHILNNFDIPRGVVREPGKDQNGNQLVDYTQWTTTSDLKQKRFYFRTYENSDIRYVDLNAQDLDAADIKTISMGGYETATEVGN